jgi:hypothetical protein
VLELSTLALLGFLLLVSYGAWRVVRSYLPQR